MPQYKNILIALDGQMAPRAMECVQGIFRTIFKNNEDKLQVGRLDFVDSKEEVERLVSGMNYDVLLCTERIRGVNIGAGSIKQWKNKNHLLEIILFIDASKKGGEKVRSLYKDGYYNAVYSTDLQHRSGMIINLILHGRTAEEAISYYGLEEGPVASEVILEQPSESIIEESVSVNEQMVEWSAEETPDMNVGEVVSETNPVVESVSYEQPGYQSEILTSVEETVSAVVENEAVEEIGQDIVIDEVPSHFFMKESEVVSSKDIEDVTPAEEYWSAEEVNECVVEEQSVCEQTPNDEQYVEYEQYTNEVSVVHRKPVDANSLGGEMAVMVRGKISSVVTDTVMVVECPNGGLLKNKNLIENRVITLLL